MKTKVVSFYSDIEETKYYSKHADRIISECELHDIPYYISEKDSLGTYQLNCLRKPSFILEVMEELNQPVLWVDIDSKIHKSLDYFDTLDEMVDVVVSTANGAISGIKASPLYFGNTENSKDFLRAWISTGKDIIENNKGLFDHEPLFRLVDIFRNKINMSFVGMDYCAWPGNTNESTYITMGLADVESKKESLRNLGMSEELIEWQSPGDRA